MAVCARLGGGSFPVVFAVHDGFLLRVARQTDLGVEERQRLLVALHSRERTAGAADARHVTRQQRVSLLKVLCGADPLGERPFEQACALEVKPAGALRLRLRRELPLERDSQRDASGCILQLRHRRLESRRRISGGRTA